LADRIALGVLTRVFPPDLIDEAVATCGRTEQRQRLLPARITAYFVLCLSMYPDKGYGEVVQLLANELNSQVVGHVLSPLPSKAALFKARERLGACVPEYLLHHAAAPFGPPDTLAGRRLMVVDSEPLEIPDTPPNAAAFGRRLPPPKATALSGADAGPAAPDLRLANGQGPSGTATSGAATSRAATSRVAAAAAAGRPVPPSITLTALGEASTGAMVDVALGPAATPATNVAPGLLEHLGPAEVVVCTAATFGPRLCDMARAQQIPLIWPYSGGALPDGGRMVERQRDVPLGTTLKAEEADDEQVVKAFDSSWRLRQSLNKLKGLDRAPGLVLRSRTPELVRQEVAALACVQFAARWLIAGGRFTALD
jgi:hypothetical protein